MKTILLAILLSLTTHGAVRETITDTVRFSAISETGNCVSGRLVKSSSNGKLKLCESSSFLELLDESRFIDEDSFATNSATRVPSQQSVKAYVDAENAAQTFATDLDVATDTGGPISIDFATETLTITGGTGLASSSAGNTVTLDIDSSVVTLTGTQSLTNKTLEDPVFDGDISGTAFLNENDLSSDSPTKIPSQASVKAYVDDQNIAQSLAVAGDSGGNLEINLSADVLTLVGGTGITTSGSGDNITIDIDSTVVTLTGSQTLQNKSIDADDNTITDIDNNEIKAAAAIAVNKLAAVDASRAVVSDGSGFITTGSTTATEIGFVNGVTSNIQTQLDDKLDKVAGSVNNLGLSLSGGTLTLLSASGTNLSSSNPGHVVMQSTTAGQTVKLSVTSNYTINDDNNAGSDFTNYGWGITEGVDWSDDRPFFLYAVNRANSTLNGVDGNSVFAIALSPFKRSTPGATTSIGDTGAIPSTDDQHGIIILADVTIADYTSLPMQLVGIIRMRWSSANTDWAVQALSASTTGLGAEQLRKGLSAEFTMAAGQHGAASGGYMADNGGTAPAFSTNTYFYTVDPFTGWLTIRVFLNGDGGADGAGAVDAYLVLPYLSSSSAIACGMARLNKLTLPEFATCETEASSNNLRFMGSDSVSVKHTEFGAGTRTVSFTCVYRPGI